MKTNLNGISIPAALAMLALVACSGSDPDDGDAGIGGTQSTSSSGGTAGTGGGGTGALGGGGHSSGGGGQGAGAMGGGGQGAGAAGGDVGGSGTGGAAPADLYFPAGAWMYQDISQAPLDAESAQVTQWLADHGGWGTGAMRIDFSLEVLDKASTTPYQSFEPTGDFFDPDCDLVDVPVPVGGALEGEQGYECLSDGDCHLIVVDRDLYRLFEMWRANITGGVFYGGCLAAWDMTRIYPANGRGEQCTSADAAGFPIAPLLFSADEVAAGEIAHAIRFILPNARMRDGAYIRPATHAGGPSGPPEAPIYGSRWRLKASFDVNSLPSEGAKVVARAMKKYGMALADGGNIALTGQSDRFTAHTWTGLLDSYDLSSLQPTDFEVIDTGSPIAQTNDCVRTAY